MKTIASQLRNPTGKRGVELGAEMHEKNFYMIQRAIALMEVKDGDSILEIGHGSGAHIPCLMDLAADICYTGLEISETMKEMAELNNSQSFATNTLLKLMTD